MYPRLPESCVHWTNNNKHDFPIRSLNLESCTLWTLCRDERSVRSCSVWAGLLAAGWGQIAEGHMGVILCGRLAGSVWRSVSELWDSDGSSGPVLKPRQQSASSHAEVQLLWKNPALSQRSDGPEIQKWNWWDGNKQLLKYQSSTDENTSVYSTQRSTSILWCCAIVRKLSFTWRQRSYAQLRSNTNILTESWVHP